MKCIVYTSLNKRGKGIRGVCVGSGVNPTHPTHHALTAVEGVREGEEERERVWRRYTVGCERYTCEEADVRGRSL